MNVAIAALTERLPEVKDALDRKEQVILLHEGKEFASLQPVFDVEAEIERIKKLPAVGMWDDREDMKDPSEWVRNLRRGRYNELFKTAGGNKE